MSTVQKRIHVSGLTPAITTDDLNARLRGFGKVLAIDGHGVLNAVGEPRKFAYVTLEASESNIARCLNVLSGTTWKGAKLRLGEAKPDYKERIEKERKGAAEAVNTRLVKRQRLPRGVQGVHVSDMSPITFQNVDSHPGWQKTVLSHLIRPMRMRPAHPLPDPITAKRVDTTKTKTKKRNTLEAPTRARIQTIDPRLYGSIHLGENMLDSVVVQPSASLVTSKRPRLPSPPLARPSTPDCSSSDENEPPVPMIQKPAFRAISVTDAVQPEHGLPDNFAQEKAQVLDLLNSMFGDDENDWGGKESVDGEILDGLDAMSVEEELPPGKGFQPEAEPVSENPSSSPSPSPLPPSLEKSKHKSLQEMFRPHEEEAGFSLLAGLGDLDLDPAFEVEPHPPSTAILPVTAPVPMPQEGITLDPNLPFFFPQPDNPRAKDIFFLARTEGWEFGRSGDSDAIRKRWEETKGPLTREWKRRAREATKARRRRYGGAEGEDA